jgi:hypothetical protein
MIFEKDEYTVDCPAAADTAVLRGVMRLATPAAYDRVFAPIVARVSTGGPMSLDLTNLTFMNSSGIRALATLVLKAKERGAPLRLIANAKIPWQKKTATSLAALNKDLTLELR